MSSNEAAGESKPEAYQFSPARPELPSSSSPEGYVEDCDEPRTTLGACFNSRLKRPSTRRLRSNYTGR